jgi:hypothetical protein
VGTGGLLGIKTMLRDVGVLFVRLGVLDYCSSSGGIICSIDSDWWLGRHLSFKITMYFSHLKAVGSNRCSLCNVSATI